MRRPRPSKRWLLLGWVVVGYVAGENIYYRHRGGAFNRRHR